MEFGIFHEFPSLPGRSHAEAFAQSFELVDGAERWGLDAMWLGELHFDPARSVPCSRSTRYCAADSLSRHSSSLCATGNDFPGECPRPLKRPKRPSAIPFLSDSKYHR